MIELYINESIKFIPMIFIFIGAYFLHFLSDLVIDPFTSNQKIEFSNRLYINHIAIYSAILLNYYILLSLMFVIFNKAEFSLILQLIDDQIFMTAINIVSHAIIDYVLAPFRSRYFNIDGIRKFWGIIGLDQFLHISILTATTAYYSHLLLSIFTK